MGDISQSLIASTVGICLLFATANALLAVRSAYAGSLHAFAIAFSMTAVTAAMTALLPVDPETPGIALLLINGAGAVAMTAMWCALWLRAGRSVNWWFMGCLVGIWMAPVLAILLLRLDSNSYVPFALLSIAAGVASSSWHLFNKQRYLNAGDRALIGWLVVVLPLSIAALGIGIRNAQVIPGDAWTLYLSFLPTLFTGIGLFALLGFTLDAIHDSTQLALTDSLTGLQNRRAFDSELAVAVARAERYQRDLSLMLLDLDHFKILNDTYGHPAGDAVLRAVARVLIEKSRRIDMVARIGGEEFALILSDTPSSAALRLAERLRQAISNASSDSIAFSASFGVASLQDTESKPEALLKAADKALYAAKDAGRNCVRYAAQLEREPSTLIELVR